jgi:predicted nucleotide-binding protein
LVPGITLLAISWRRRSERITQTFKASNTCGPSETADGVLLSGQSITLKVYERRSRLLTATLKELNVEIQLREPITPPASRSAPPMSKKIFIVHGHDSTAREQLELIIHRLGLDPFVLQNTGGGGLTIIEALEQEIGPSPGSARFGIVLLTPDDVGYAKSETVEKSQPRARQNFVLEMGMLIAALGRSHVAILKKGYIEVPSDAQGIIYISFAEHVKESVPKLVDRLSAAGFSLNAAAIRKASS